MQRESQTEFQIEEMQPFLWLSDKQRGLYGLIGGLVFGLILGLISWVFFDLTSGDVSRQFLRDSRNLLGRGIYEMFNEVIYGLSGGGIYGLMGVLIGGLFFGLFLRLSDDTKIEIKLTEKANLPYSRVWASLILGLILGLLSSLGVALGLGLVFGLISVNIIVLIGMTLYSLFYTTYLGLIGGVFYAVFEALKSGKSIGEEVDIKSILSQGFWKSASKALFAKVIFYLFWGLIFGLGFQLINIFHPLKFPKDHRSNNWWSIAPIDFITYGLFFGLVAGLFFGGMPLIRHFSLRLSLFRSGSIPWNYTRFLNYCRDRLLLQRVGRRYRFTHKLLQDRLAEVVN